MPSTVIGAAGFDRLFTTSVDQHRSEFVDQVTRKRVLLALLRPNLNRGGMNGRQLVLPLIGADLDQTETSDASGTFTFGTSRNIVGSAVYEASLPILTHTIIDWMALQQNAGKERIASLVDIYAAAAIRDQERTISNRLWAQTSDPGDPLTVYELVSDTTPVGGIDPANADYWKSVVETYDPATEGVVEGFRKLVDGVAENQNDGDMSGKILIAGKNPYAEYRATFDEAKRYQTTHSVGDVEFKGLEYDGLPVIRDFDCGDNDVFLLDKNHLWFSDLNGQFLAPQGQRQVVSNDGDGNAQGTLNDAQVLVTSCALGVDSRRVHGRLTRVP